ncbi:endoribonuclease L-PSP [Bacillus manliponensis]|uniref:Endoribonuclease L-PSP n=1 Tax=Bacillus manliponensis TaxID=574376 RepID=A0A073JU26_9BACI|nr:RidA family protein [Bacillus manliponensis]KEK18544.1 endoribonuclease L-PSP [Bacillus manliponensis]
MPNKTVISSNSPFENYLGSSRAVKVGNIIAIAGTAPIDPNNKGVANNVYDQTKSCIEIIKNAVEEMGLSLENIVRTKIYLTDMKNVDEAAKAHKEYFDQIKPACTVFEVNRFIKEEWLVEIEADCIVPEE